MKKFILSVVIVALSLNLSIVFPKQETINNSFNQSHNVVVTIITTMSEDEIGHIHS